MLENETSGFRMPSFAGYSTGLGLPMPHHRPPPGVATPAHLQHAANGPDMFSAGGILSSIAPPSSTMLPTVVSTNTSSTLPPPPPGLPAFPQFSHDGGVPSSTVNNIGFPGTKAFFYLSLVRMIPDEWSENRTRHSISIFCLRCTYLFVVTCTFIIVVTILFGYVIINFIMCTSYILFP